MEKDQRADYVEDGESGSTQIGLCAASPSEDLDAVRRIQLALKAVDLHSGPVDKRERLAGQEWAEQAWGSSHSLPDVSHLPTISRSHLCPEEVS